MEFFCDTGIFIGYCNPGDDHHDNCVKFLKKFSPDENPYFTCLHVEFELDRKRREVRREFPEIIARRIFQCIETLLEKMKSVNYSNEGLFPLLETALNAVIDNRDDSRILSHAFFWCQEDYLEDPFFITVDWEDIVRKRNIIKRTAENVFLKEKRLTIEAVWNL